MRLKIKSVLLCTVFLLAGSLSTPAGSLSTPAGARETVEVAMILWRGETPSERGFKETLLASGKYRFRFTVFDADQSREQLDRIIAGLDRSKYRLIYTFGTTVTQEVQKSITDTPLIFNIVQRPVEAGIIRSWENSGNNATGASNLVSAESAFQTLSLVMQIRKLGFLYFEKDPAAQIQKDDIERQQKRFGFRKIDLPIKSKETLSETLRSVVEAKVDAVLIPSDSFVKANAERIISTLNKYKIPTIVIIPEMVKENGALLALGPDYHLLGQLAAENALEVVRGRKPAAIATRTVPNLSISINLRTADQLRINFPLQLLKISTVTR